MVFFADLNYISDTYRGIAGAGDAPRHPGAGARPHPAAVVHGRGDHAHRRSAATFSISHQHPFYAARLWATLDHLTRGPRGVERRDLAQPQPVGELRRGAPPTDERYDRAHEFIEVCRKLWASWDEDAVVMDRDGARLRRSGQGPSHRARRAVLQVARAAQRRALAAERAGDPAGRHLAQGPRLRRAVRRRDLRHPAALAGRQGATTTTSRAAWPSAGRPPEACKILFGVQPIIGATRGRGAREAGEHNALVPLEGGMAILSGHLDFDLSKLPLDAVMADRTEPRAAAHADPLPHADGRAADPARGGAAPRPERRPAADGRHAQSRSPTSWKPIATSVGGDGFMLSPIYSPGAIEEFVDLVVPELQRRGRYRRDYAGTTQRDHLNQDFSTGIHRPARP